MENVYRVQIMNTDEKARAFAIGVTGLPDLQVVGIAQPVALEASSSRLLALRVQAAWMPTQRSRA